ncbi:hypothetical protein BJ684DRAFT_20871 [Piptocephalis cylindrospora]|uniref:DUF2306 domain-containing protein n=1 Tax=Piptocephalis cylindrospora TaxID=1907219 RepID=A0A4P9Y3B0_9FUNG|nr:hypothetical protein BJ684DRAFT_20871 [Piptocephalis cylindrospora]|eukprot:RKP12601.1 hypothetical protein BJ684DRAFT_20871 [Piptocephalis cylindrospora]
MNSQSDQTPLLPRDTTTKTPQLQEAYDGNANPTDPSPRKSLVVTEEVASNCPQDPRQYRKWFPSTPSRLAMIIVWVIFILGSIYFAHYIFFRYLIHPPSSWHNRITDFGKYWYGAAAIGVHFIAGFIITIIGPLQISQRVRKWKPSFHRLNGRVYLVSSVIVSIAGMLYVVTARTVGGINMDICFFFFGVCFFYTSVRTWKTARDKQYALHREWAIRTFTLGVGSLLYRFYVIPVKMHKELDMSLETQYLWLNIAGWVMFLPNVIIVEPYLWYTRTV